MTGHRTWAIVPVKRFSEAKLRLAPRLSEPQRAALTQAMLEDLVEALTVVPEIDALCIASDEPSLSVAPHLLLHDPADATLNDAVQHAVDVIVERGAETCCILHADLPLASSDGVSRLLRDHRSQGGPSVTLAPDRRGRGTNVIICTPASALDFCYGGNSLAAHRTAAARVGITVRVIRDDALALDVDTPGDLDTLKRDEAAAGIRTRAFLSGLAATCASRRGV